MSDNLQGTPGVGLSIRSHQLTSGPNTGAHVQHVVLVDDTDAAQALATAAKQPALGTAGTPSADVLTVQGAASMTALKVDASATTQPVSAAALPLPAGAATAAKQPAIGTAGAASADVITVQGNASGTPIPVSVGSIALPAGASTAAKQPALGTAGTPSTDVLTVQGAASMTALKVDASATTQPVSAAALPLPAGAATAAKQPALGTAGAASADVITVQGNASGTPIPVSVGSIALPTGASTAAKQPALGTAGTPSTDVLTVQGAASMTALKVDASATTQPVSAAALPLPTGAATDATLTANGVLAGPLTETAPASDTASSGLNGRLQRIAQRLTTLIGTTLATSVADGSSVTMGAKADSAANNSTSSWTLVSLLKGIYQNTIGRVSGQLAMASSLSVVTASDDVNIGPTVLVNSSAVAAVNQLLIPSTDISLYGKLYLHLTNAATGCTFILQCSNDNTNWDSIYGTPTNQAFGAPSSTLNGARMIEVPGGYKWFRCICSVYGSGSPTAVLSCSPKGNSQSPFFAATITPIPVVNQGPATFFRSQNPSTTGGPTNVKSLNAIVAHLAVTNAGASDLYLQLYNKGSAPVLGTDTPNMTYRVKAGTNMVIDFGPFGSRWSNGFSYAVTSDYGGATGVTTAADATVTGLYT